MSNQLEISFKTASPINTESIMVKNQKVFDHLMQGLAINTFVAHKLYGTRHLHSRVPEISKVLRDHFEVKIERKMVTVTHDNGEQTRVMSYWLSKESIDIINGFRKQVKKAA